jgi:hypothetical protein
MLCGKCECITTANVPSESGCIAATEDSARFDCDTTARSCDELSAWHAELDSVARQFAPQIDPPNLLDAVKRCNVRITSELESRCYAAPDCNCAATELGETRCERSLEGICAAAPLCQPNLALVHAAKIAPEFDTYAECDDGTTRFESIVGGESLYRLVYDTESGSLTYAYAEGWVANQCLPEGGIGTILAGTPPVQANCQRCDVYAGFGGEGGSGATCVLDANGVPSLPH